jgi:para-nitrobenzyl esterase
MKSAGLRILVIVTALIVAGMSVRAQTGGPFDAMNPPIVEVADGQLLGYMDEGTFAFLGIQYATANRFEMPQEVEPWEGVKSAQTYGAICLIPDQTTVSADEYYWPHRYWPQNEACQFLNIWTPGIQDGAKRPVMVWLHGGAFTNGSSIEAVAYEGKNLSEFGDVVVVSLNHRLNVLGTLDLSAYGEQFANSGNTGMADIEAALRWVRENIEVFGGDPDNVTIFGQSGGSGKVVTLMHMPSAEGLFHKAIAQSSGTASVMLKEDSMRIAEVMLEILGLDVAQVDVLQTMPYDDLLEVASNALDQVRDETGRNIGWRPVLDEQYILAEYADWAANIPMIIGTVFSERSSTFQIGDGRKNSWTQDETYANIQERFDGDTDEIITEFTRLFPWKRAADAFFYAYDYRSRVKGALEYRLEHTSAPVYNYLFAFEAPVNGGITPFHCAELIYVFHNVEIPILQRATGGTSEAYQVQDAIAGAWVNFARTGNPSQDGLEWGPYSVEGQETMIFDSNSVFKVLDDERLVELMSQ